MRVCAKDGVLFHNNLLHEESVQCTLKLFPYVKLTTPYLNYTA